MEIPFQTLITVALSTSAALFAVWITRKNLRTSKYIDTVTAERIKWIETVRNDFSLLISSILIIRENEEKYHEIKFEAERIGYVRNITNRDYLEDDELSSDYDTDKLLSNMNLLLKKCLTPAEVVLKSTQLQLKLNPNEDTGIIKSLELISNEFSNASFKKADSKIQLEQLINSVQSLLKREWKRVKDEVHNK